MINYVNWWRNSAKIGSTSADTLKVIYFVYLERTHKQVKEHYINYLRPEIKKDDWTLD